MAPYVWTEKKLQVIKEKKQKTLLIANKQYQTKFEILIIFVGQWKREIQIVHFTALNENSCWVHLYVANRKIAFILLSNCNGNAVKTGKRSATHNNIGWVRALHSCSDQSVHTDYLLSSHSLMGLQFDRRLAREFGSFPERSVSLCFRDSVTPETRFLPPSCPREQFN